MPLTIYPSTLKIKDSNGTFHSADCIKGDQGPQGNPVDVQINGTSILSNGVANIPIADVNNPGAVKIGGYGLDIYNGIVRIDCAVGTIKTGSSGFAPIVPSHQHEATFYGLAKAAGDTTQAQSNNAVGTYTDDAKTAIRSMLGAIGSTDYATVSTPGVIKVDRDASAIGISNGILQTLNATDDHIKGGAVSIRMLTPASQHKAVFYGLAKVAGDTTQSQSNNAVGTYTDDAKAAIRSMIGAISSSDHATSTTYGVIKIGGALRSGLDVPDGNPDFIYVNSTTVNGCKNGNSTTFPLTPSVEDAATFYGLAKAAGDLTQAQSNNTVGIYTDEAKSAIRSMLGAVGSTDYATSSTCGIVKPGGRLEVDSSGKLNVRMASDSNIKGGATNDVVITPGGAYRSAFYGLAKAAGDTTQAQSDNAVGTYTSDAKSAIQNMLGIENGVSFVETITGSTPTITGVANTRYVCGEVTSISITPPNAGTIIVRFTSGSTVAVLTLPNTVKMPEWFDATSLETNYIYELCIEDGVYGSVMVWPT